MDSMDSKEAVILDRIFATLLRIEKRLAWVTRDDPYRKGNDNG